MNAWLSVLRVEVMSCGRTILKSTFGDLRPAIHRQWIPFWIPMFSSIKELQLKCIELHRISQKIKPQAHFLSCLTNTFLCPIKQVGYPLLGSDLPVKKC